MSIVVNLCQIDWGHEIRCQWGAFGGMSGCKRDTYSRTIPPQAKFLPDFVLDGQFLGFSHQSLGDKGGQWGPSGGQKVDYGGIWGDSGGQASLWGHIGGLWWAPPGLGAVWSGCCRSNRMWNPYYCKMSYESKSYFNSVIMTTLLTVMTSFVVSFVMSLHQWHHSIRSD